MLNRIESPAAPYGWRPVLIMAALFFSIGFVTWLNGPLITFVQVAFTLDNVTAFLVPACFYLAYFFFPLPATLLSRRIGLRRGIIVALLVMAVGTALFGECVTARLYAGALGGLTVIGAGLSLLQITINPYVSLLGNHARAAQRIAIMGTANKFAGILAPMMFAMLVMPHVNDVAASLHTIPAGPQREAILAHFAHAVHGPYAAMAGVLVVLAILVARSALPEISIDTTPPGNTISRRTQPVWLITGVLCMFLYVGVEVLAGDAIGLYGRSMGLSLDVTKYLTSLTLAAMMAGYVLGMVAVPRFIAQQRYMILSCAAGIAICVAAIISGGITSVLCVALLGFANAMILPALFPVVLAEASSDPAQATAYLVMAYSGGAVIPQIFVYLSAHIGIQTAFMALAIPCYLVMAAWMLALSARRVWASSSAAPMPLGE